jgi:nitroreductase
MNVMEAIKNRRSVRSYSSKRIPDEIMQRMRDALRYAPSACNYQPCKFIFVSDPELNYEVAKAANDQVWMSEAPVIVVGCGLPEQAYKFMGGKGNSVDIDVAIALDHLTLAATEEGLGTCWVGAFDEGRVKALLGVPADVKIVVMTPLGYPASADLMAPLPEGARKGEGEIFAADHYDKR